MLAEFQRHFWQTRVPAFQALWAACESIPPETWSNDLKLSLHGLAGVAALVDQPALGDLARAIEQQWDTEGASEALLPALHELNKLIKI